MGDAAGIGPEIIAKALMDPSIRQCCHPVVVGSRRIMEWAVRPLGLDLAVGSIDSLSGPAQTPGAIPVIDCVPLRHEEVALGRISAQTGRAAAESIIQAAEMALAGAINGIVTAPVSKEALHRAGYRFPGQTEFLAHLTNSARFAMMLVGGKLRVALVTTHCPLDAVPELVTTERVLEKLEVVDEALRAYFGILEPRTGVCALNPHGGEGGLLGEEELRAIGPAIDLAHRKGIKAIGPFPADTIFAKWDEQGFDAILAMYHDQALIPLKMTSFGRGVNTTLGLPIVRTSPDHGTAFDIAGRGIADPGSLMEAIGLAAQMAKLRTTSDLATWREPP